MERGKRFQDYPKPDPEQASRIKEVVRTQDLKEQQAPRLLAAREVQRLMSLPLPFYVCSVDGKPYRIDHVNLDGMLSSAIEPGSGVHLIWTRHGKPQFLATVALDMRTIAQTEALAMETWGYL